MTNLRTKEEIYNDYSTGIRQLENEVTDLKNEIEDKQYLINGKEYRIKKLKETAEMYNFINNNFTIKISSPKVNSIEEIEKLSQAIKSELDNYVQRYKL